MPLQDVSHDSSLIGWLRQSGHGHLLSDQHQPSNTVVSSSAPIIHDVHSDRTYQSHSFDHSSPALRIDNSQDQSYGYQPAAANFVSSPTQFLAPHMHQHQFDAEVENLRRDPNTRIVQHPNHNDLVYKQRVFVKYLQPPTPPVGGTIIVREKQLPPPPPEPPLIIKRAPPPPLTPPPVVIRERPPPMPPAEATVVINRIMPPAPQPPRQVIIEQYPQLPPKPQDVILERWLPRAPRQRRILYERLPAPIANQPACTQPMIVQYDQPNIRIHREVITQPGVHLPQQHIAGHPDINHMLSQMNCNQQIYSTLPSSSLVAYNPYSTIQPACGSLVRPQSNIVVMQQPQPNTISSSSYGLPLSYVCPPNLMTGLGAYGSGISTMPTVGHTAGQSTVYTVPENVPIDHVLRQLGIEPHSLQHATGIF